MVCYFVTWADGIGIIGKGSISNTTIGLSSVSPEACIGIKEDGRGKVSGISRFIPVTSKFSVPYPGKFSQKEGDVV